MSDAANAAATATQSQGTESTGSPGGINTQPDGENGVVDYAEILARQQHDLARTGKTVERLSTDLERSHGTLDRVRKAFTGDEEQLSPFQKRMQSYQDLGSYLDQVALDDKTRGGAGYPATTKIGKQLVELGLESEKRAQTLEQELAEIKAQLRRQQNPAFQGLERAAFAMEGMVQSGLESMYGNEPGSRQIRAAQFNAVTARINEEIKDLMQNDPEALLKVQRDPKIMRKMVNHFMAEMLPPKVRNMLDDERIKNEPFDTRDLYQAFAEAREQWQTAQTKGDVRAEEHYSGLMTSIRHDILGAQQESRRSNNGKPTLNQLFGNR